MVETPLVQATGMHLEGMHGMVEALEAEGLMVLKVEMAAGTAEVLLGNGD